MSDDGFLSRWSRRKAQVKAGVAPAPHPSPLPRGEREPAASGVEAESSLAPLGRGTEGEGAAPHEAPPPPPTMEDAAALEPGADIQRFIAPQVDESVQRVALKKLFADPHFNVMDGLDTYIEDYGQPDPIPESMLRKMVQSHALGLFAHEEPDPKASTDGEAAAAVPQSSDVSKAVPDEDADLRLQQDDAAGPGGTEPGPRT
jgi:hypothetical protein